MDRLYSKYADPISLLDGIISMGRFSDFVDEFLDAENEKTLWEFFLHKVYDKSFDDFKKSYIHSEMPSDEQLETTVLKSKIMLNQFTPNERG